ncbi:hypothetical protein KJ359_004102 [Pestalotiopsis sp. 9143b]|nr:hypothetical protein KJ359_004102 [Pestalotiopsis sp. 9143b]
MDSSTRPPSVEAIKAVISQALPGAFIESVRALPSTRLQRDACIEVSDGRVFFLTIPPPPMLRLLRSEQWLVLSEALLIPWIYRLPANESRNERVSIQYLIGTGSVQSDRSALDPTPADQGRYDLSSIPLVQFLPAFIAHSPRDPSLGVAFNLIQPTQGSIISLLSPPLSEEERAEIEYQQGQLVRKISSLKAHNSKFGPVVAVLGQHAPPTDTNSATGLVGSGGTDSWSKAFLAMVEGILRDGEDLAVTISYSLIRHHVKRLGHLLGAVTQSRLVILDAGSDTNVLVHRRTRSETRSGTHDTPTSTTRRAPTHIDTSEEDSSRSRHWETLVGKTTSAADTNQDSHVGLSVSGLLDWSNCIFGDPLMAEVFNADPPADFIRGFRQQPPRGKTTASTTSPASIHLSRASSPPPDDLIEDRENASIRLLLYECYHATHAVVKQFHRPAGTDGTRREMEARRRLAAVLNRLAEVDDNVAKRPRSGSLDMWPMKKSKVES